jgi:hypothetical protein
VRVHQTCRTYGPDPLQCVLRPLRAAAACIPYSKVLKGQCILTVLMTCTWVGCLEACIERTSIQFCVVQCTSVNLGSSALVNIGTGALLLHCFSAELKCHRGCMKEQAQSTLSMPQCIEFSCSNRHAPWYDQTHAAKRDLISVRCQETGMQQRMSSPYKEGWLFTSTSRSIL